MSTVEALLAEKGIHCQDKGKDLLVRCLNPEHEDSNPSMRVDRERGLFHCLSCGYKGDIFKFFNKESNPNTGRAQRLIKKVFDIRRESTGLEMPETAMPVTEGWRGISLSTLTKFHAFEDPKLFPDRVAFPITDLTGRIVIFQARYKYSDATPKYVFHPRHVAPPLYPARVAPINGSIILVEGLLDAISLYDNGLENAVCMFGTSKLTEANIVEQVTPYILQGTRKVFLMLDGDKAGYIAGKKIASLIRLKTNLEVAFISLDKDTDPGDLSFSQVQQVMKLIN